MLFSSCAQNSVQENRDSKNNSSLANIAPAGPDEALFVGDAEEKVKSVLKRSVTEEKGASVQDTSYYSSDLKANLNEYYLLLNGKVLQGFCVADGKLRNIFSILDKVPNKKVPLIVNKIKSEPSLEHIRNGVYKSRGNKLDEYVMFLLVENVKADSTLIGVFTAPNGNQSDEIISHMKNFITVSAKKRPGLIVRTSFID